MVKDFIIRKATLADAAEILDIYTPYILDTAITFESEPISLEDLKKRMEKIQSKYPWVVCETEGHIVGYAYCSRFRERASYDWDCECSIYVKDGFHGAGIASMLYTKLFDLAYQLGYYNIYAVIGYPNERSEALHKKFGFRKVGILEHAGYKLGKWRDVMIMEKKINSSEETPAKPKLISEISDF